MARYSRGGSFPIVPVLIGGAALVGVVVLLSRKSAAAKQADATNAAILYRREYEIMSGPPNMPTARPPNLPTNGEPARLPDAQLLAIAPGTVFRWDQGFYGQQPNQMRATAAPDRATRTVMAVNRSLGGGAPPEAVPLAQITQIGT